MLTRVRIAATLVAAVLATLAARQPAPSVRGFDALVDEYLRLRWSASPAIATEDGAEGYNDKLPDYSAAAVTKRIADEKALLARVQAADPAGLSPDQQIDRQLLVGLLESDVHDLERRRPPETNPELYVPFSALASLIDKDNLPLADRARDLTARLRAVPRLVEQARANLKNPPRSFTGAAIFQTGATIRFLTTDLGAFAERAGERRQPMLDAVKEAIAALKTLETFLRDDLLPRSSGTWTLGRADYDFILKRRWFMDDDAEAILAKGRKAFAETEALLQQTAERISPGKPWVEVYERLKDDHPPADGINAAYQAQMDAARAYLTAHDIVTLPDGERVITVDTPPALRRSSPFGTFDSVGPFEKHLQGRLVLTPIEESLTAEQRRERLRSHHTAWIPIIAVHEAYPGHHVQALKANQNPRVLRRAVRESIFAEGWGLFCEEMMWEQGFLRGDEVRLTQLRNRLWRAARVIIDVGMHTGTMTFDEGAQFLVDNVRFERYAAELEVGMYTRRPTMVLGYLIGMMEIQDIRERYYAKFGKPAKPKEFYDKLLSVGAIPPALVRRALIG